MLWAVRGQIFLLLGAIYAGLGVGFLYTLCRLLRSPRGTLGADLAFALSCCVWLFAWFYMLVSLNLRLYHLLGVTAGFFLWRWGPEELLLSVFPSLARKLKERYNRKK
nr:hypothetical protein [bacterium]